MKILIILFSLQLFWGCDALRSTKRKLKGMILGTPQEAVKDAESAGSVAQEGQQEGTQEGSQSEQFEVSEKLVEITPRTKIFNIHRAFVLNPDESYKGLLLKEMNSVRTLFSEKKDDELVAQLVQLVPLFQGQNQHVQDVALQWYVLLRGENQLEMAKVLSQMADVDPLGFIKMNAYELRSDECKLAQLVPGHIGADEQKNYLDGRYKSLSSQRDELHGDALLIQSMENCVNVVRNAVLRLDPNHNFEAKLGGELDY